MKRASWILPVSVSTDRKIDKELIADYFTAVKEKNNILNPSDIGVYSKKMLNRFLGNSKN